MTHSSRSDHNGIVLFWGAKRGYMAKDTRSIVHGLATSLHRLRLYFILICVAAFVILATLSYRGMDLTWASLLTFMWLFGIAFTVGKALQLSDPASKFRYSTYVFNISVAVLWWGFLIYATVSVVFS